MPFQTDPTAVKKFIGAVEDEWQLYSDRSSDYTVGPTIGFGASSIVYAAQFHPPDSPSIPCALKVLDLDLLPPHSLSLLQKETILMSLSKHPNVLRVRGSWMDGHKLYIALRLMNRGSAADIMNYGWPGGMEEDVVRCILQQALLGLNYLHINGFIHRDVKAANLLLDDDGTVLLGDLGVAADLADDSSSHSHHTHYQPRRHTHVSAVAALHPTGSHSQNSTHSSGVSVNSPKRIVLFDNTRPMPAALHVRPKIGKRKSFVGTPCWMAPELIQGRQYDSSADIWSFGITALELTQGRPPKSRETPQKVLIKTIQEAPPTLDREGGTYKYSRAFKEMVDSCLVKDPSKRPSAEQLLQTPFFKAAKKKSYLVGAILKDLPPLTQRQERRATAYSTTGPNTMDSWDFTATLGSLLSHSPIGSLHSRPSFRDAPISSGVFELESDEMEWDEDEDRDDNNEEREFGIKSENTETTNDKKSTLHTVATSFEEMNSSTKAGETNTASSFAFPSSPGQASADHNLSSGTEDPSTEGSPSSPPSKSPDPAFGPPHKLVSRPIPMNPLSPSVTQMSVHKQPSMSTSAPTNSTSPTLWRKIKSATTSRRPSGPVPHPQDTNSEDTLTTVQSHSNLRSHMHPHLRPHIHLTLHPHSKVNESEVSEKEKDKPGRMGTIARKASAAQNALVRTTSRTAQAVGFGPSK